MWNAMDQALSRECKMQLVLSRECIMHLVTTATEKTKLL